jgi:hypothetical protein
MDRDLTALGYRLPATDYLAERGYSLPLSLPLPEVFKLAPDPSAFV